MSTTRLSALLPATAGAPVSPPSRKSARVSRLNEPFALPRPWHCTQLASKIGWMSRAKSTRAFDAGGISARFSGGNAP